MRTTAAFEDFLLNYKSTQSDLDLAATDAFQDLNIDGDGTSDEYDFLDDVVDGKAARHAGQYKEPTRKYIDMLQKVADRQLGEVTIELDDLDNVSEPFRLRTSMILTIRRSMRKALVMVMRVRACD